MHFISDFLGEMIKIFPRSNSLPAGYNLHTLFEFIIALEIYLSFKTLHCVSCKYHMELVSHTISVLGYWIKINERAFSWSVNGRNFSIWVLIAFAVDMCWIPTGLVFWGLVQRWMLSNEKSLKLVLKADHCHQLIFNTKSFLSF